ncbi:putative metalloprotease CJM1_0395 family protein [Azospirillum thermophilum]|uniref:Catalase n=1 Tax=Azospirillum thermophilum TaxID=2202148 RepID=A0A2S2CR92_9PROT|nr:putative metalloprotease CJM1_0395 family protein [Azospirillum thermophilum]AWK86979.1 hypothetical protein DEW08_12730 [Azospirillum thermophilum]
MVGGLSSLSPLAASYGLPRLGGGAEARAGKGGQETDREAATQAAGGPQSPDLQSPEIQQQIQKLKETDSRVRQHEAAHQAAGGGLAGGASFTTTRGPDGKTYATGGEVPIDISREADPQATIAKMEQVKAAALAPADPSPQDLRVAAQADATKAQARQELSRAQSQANGTQANGTQAGGSPGSGSRETDGPAGGMAAMARGIAAYSSAQGLGAAPNRGAGLVV